VSEYGHVSVTRPIYLNRALRKADLLAVRRGPFGEAPDLFDCRAFAVCDHQLAHIYIPEATTGGACATFSPRCPASRASTPTKSGPRSNSITSAPAT